MQDELNCSHNGGVVVYLLQSVAIHFNHTQCVLGRHTSLVYFSRVYFSSRARTDACMHAGSNTWAAPPDSFGRIN